MSEIELSANKRTPRLSIAAARRIALAAQGFSPGSRPVGREPGLAAITAAVRRLGLLQLDSVNVFCRAHYMPLFSRLGPYDKRLLDRIAAHGDGRVDRRLVEYWAHEASLIPVENHRLFHWRMDERQRIWAGMRRVLTEHQGLIEETLTLVREQGPIRARDTGHERKNPVAGEMWNWHEGKVALEALFFTGAIGAWRRINFERHYDLIERILSPELLAAPVPTREQAHRELTRLAARALGVATVADLGDYWRITQTELMPRVAELVTDGELIPVDVAGWDAPGYLWHQARRPRSVKTRALLSPFDSLIFFRPRTERLFGFHYRIEIYTPEPKRIHGYYVLPFLLNERLVARVDLKSDRQAGVLRVQGAFAEAGIDAGHVARELARELELCAGWLGLANGVTVGERGDLAPALQLEL
jgi:uncharacterized protein YcaQ